MSMAFVHLLPTFRVPKAGYRIDKAIQKLKRSGKIKKLEAMGLLCEEFDCSDDDDPQVKARLYRQKLISLIKAMNACQELSSVDFNNTALDDACVDEAARLLPRMLSNLEFLGLSNTGLSEQHFQRIESALQSMAGGSPPNMPTRTHMHVLELQVSVHCVSC